MPDKPQNAKPTEGKKPEPPAGGGGGSEKYDALLQVMEQEAEKVRQEGAFGAATPGEGKIRLIVLGLLVVSFGLVTWKGEEWLGPEPIPAPTLAEAEQSLRVGMYLQAQRIKAFQLENGRYPEQLDEAGEPLPGLRYQLVEDGVYELVGENHGVTITYRSDRPLGEFLGEAEGVLGLGAD